MKLLLWIFPILLSVSWFFFCYFLIDWIENPKRYDDE